MGAIVLGETIGSFFVVSDEPTVLFTVEENVSVWIGINRGGQIIQGERINMLL